MKKLNFTELLSNTRTFHRAIEFMFDKNKGLYKDVQVSDIFGYLKTREILLALPDSDKKPAIIEVVKDDNILDTFYDVNILNEDFVGLPPLDENGKFPPGIDINDEKYCKYFSFLLDDWSSLKNAVIQHDTDLFDHEILAYVMYELTFDGFTPAEHKEFKEKLENILKTRIETANLTGSITFEEFKEKIGKILDKSKDHIDDIGAL